MAVMILGKALLILCGNWISQHLLSGRGHKSNRFLNGKLFQRKTALDPFPDTPLLSTTTKFTFMVDLTLAVNPLNFFPLICGIINGNRLEVGARYHRVEMNTQQWVREIP